MVIPAFQSVPLDSRVRADRQQVGGQNTQPFHTASRILPVDPVVSGDNPAPRGYAAPFPGAIFAFMQPQ